jgi:hypothetical protein
MTVLSFCHPATSLLEVDVFAHHPIDFERALRRASLKPIAGIFVPVAHVDDLLELKRLANRRDDAEDIAALSALRLTKLSS